MRITISPPSPEICCALTLAFFFIHSLTLLHILYTLAPSFSLSRSCIYTPDMTFAALGVDRWLVDSLHAMAIRKPTPIQSACIGPILAGSPSPCPSSIHPSLC